MRKVGAYGGRARRGSGGLELEGERALLPCSADDTSAAACLCRWRRRLGCRLSGDDDDAVAIQRSSAVRARSRPTDSSFVGKQVGSPLLSLHRCVLPSHISRALPPRSSLSPSEGEAARCLSPHPASGEARATPHASRESTRDVTLNDRSSGFPVPSSGARDVLSNGRRKARFVVVARARSLVGGAGARAREALAVGPGHACWHASDGPVAALEAGG